jgi:hypothetical protein
MNADGLHLLLAFVASLAGIGWSVDYRRRVTAERQRDIHARIATEKGRRLMVALDERDAARRHADDAQWLANSIITGDHGSRDRHPSNVRVLHAIDGGA